MDDATRDRPSRTWQFSLSHLLLAMLPLGLLFAWLGALESTTPLHLLVAGIVTVGCLAVECLGDHAALAGVAWPFRASYFVARMAVFHALCFFACLISFRWQPAPNFPKPSAPNDPFGVIVEVLQWLSVLLPYVYGFVIASIVAWIANIHAAGRIRRARWLLAVTTLPGVVSVFLLLWILSGGH
jgi:hypothetical protein